MGALDFIYNIPGLWKVQVTMNQFLSYVPPPPPKNQGTPRKILIVTSHPVPESYSLAIATTVEETAKEQGHEVQRIDLGLEKFDPVLNKKERLAYFDETNKEDKNLPKDVRGYIQKLKWCDTLFFVYPTWWVSDTIIYYFCRLLLLLLFLFFVFSTLHDINASYFIVKYPGR
jgi:hypothetical protein